MRMLQTSCESVTQLAKWTQLGGVWGKDSKALDSVHMIYRSLLEEG